MMGYYCDGINSFGFGWIFMVLFWGVVIWLIFVLVRSMSDRKSDRYSENKKEDSLDILKSRYAKGEISKEEFEEIKKDILNL